MLFNSYLRQRAGCQWLTPVILATWEVEIAMPALANSLPDPISKITRIKWTGGITQAVEHALQA
jgi:hypothetical protein